MDTNKNSYTIIYATLLVVFVAAVLAFVSSSLRGRQQKNVDIEKQMSLLSSVGLGTQADKVPDKTAYIEEEYSKYITKSFIVNYEGKVIEGDAFRVDLKEQYDLMRQIAAVPADRQERKTELLARLKLPVFVGTLENGDVYIFSCYGAGLWGPIWGYVSLNSDFNTIHGATFGHKGETPGLGAEIATARFSNQFIGKEIFAGNLFASIAVVKGGAETGNPHEVDAISGGTITSQALESTLKNWLQYYLPYIESQKKHTGTTPAQLQDYREAKEDASRNIATPEAAAAVGVQGGDSTNVELRDSANVNL